MEHADDSRIRRRSAAAGNAYSARYTTTVGTVTGNPDKKHISTSYAERANPSMRMGIRRFTRLTNAFSNKVENRIYALAIYFMHYNYVRIPTRPFASPLRWPLACPRTFGPWMTL